ncbi:MAG: tandem-95 repeat protein [Lewinellaceae bacterium]|nr:tandem-95 repeat protein [Lewinellaceae bacterium]
MRFDGTNGKVEVDAAQYSLYQTNSLSGFVWDDSSNENGTFETGSENPFAGVSVKIYRDEDASGTVTTGDVLLTTKITDANGFYSYQFFAGSLPANYVMAIDEATLPVSPANNYYTTAQYQTATLTSATDSDCDNNFGRSFDNPPVANDDVATTEQNIPIVIDAIGNDQNPDVDGEVTTVTSITSPPSFGGTYSINPDGTINYTPPVGFTGVETFVYELCDEANPGVLCDEATVTVTVNPFTNDPPVANDDAATTEQDDPVSVNVLANDSDPDGDPISPPTCVGTDASAAMPAVCNGATTNGGTVTILPSGEIYYVPPPGFTGTDQTTYVICDPGGLCDDAVITFTVNADTNDPPVATDDTEVVYQPCGATTFSVLGNDYDLDGNLVPSSVTITMPLSPATGTLVNNLDGTFTYTAAGAGTFTFEYQVCDDGTPLPAQCDVATVTITVPVSNTAPTANDDGDAITSGDQLTTPVLSNDSDPEGDELTVTLCDPNNPLTACGLSSSTSTQGGTVTVLPSGKTQYTPPAGFAGTDTYFYRICDNGCPNLCDFATVTVTVENQPPVAVDDADVTAINTAIQVDVLVNDFDPEGENITLQTAGVNPLNPTGGGTLQGGSVSVNNNGTPGDPTDDFIDYTPPSNFIGQDTFYYEICDANLFDPQCDVARVIITITSPVDIELTKTVFPEQPDAGDNVTFTLTLSNTSSATATGVVVKDQLPSGLTYVSDNSGGTYDPNTGVWFIGTVPPGSSVELQIVAMVDNFTDATNVAEVTAQNEVDSDSTPNNNILGEDDQDAVILQCVLKREPISVTQNP